MNSRSLCEQLGLSPADVDRLAGEGMPTADVYAAAGWLVLNGRACVPRIVSLKYLAEFFGVTFAAVKVWCGSGMPVLDDGKVDLDAVVQWRLGRVRSNPEADKLASIKAQRAWLDLQERLGTVAPVEPMHRRMVRHINEAKAILGQLPDILAQIAAEAGMAADVVSQVRARAGEVLDRSYTAIADLGRPGRADDEGEGDQQTQEAAEQ